MRRYRVGPHPGAPPLPVSKLIVPWLVSPGSPAQKFDSALVTVLLKTIAPCELTVPGGREVGVEDLAVGFGADHRDGLGAGAAAQSEPAGRPSG